MWIRLYHRTSPVGGDLPTAHHGLGVNSGCPYLGHTQHRKLTKYASCSEPSEPGAIFLAVCGIRASRNVNSASSRHQNKHGVNGLTLPYQNLSRHEDAIHRHSAQHLNGGRVQASKELRSVYGAYHGAQAQLPELLVGHVHQRDLFFANSSRVLFEGDHHHLLFLPWKLFARLQQTHLWKYLTRAISTCNNGGCAIQGSPKHDEFSED
mmetsp:Transcript_13194/g.36344  ORF Transcript_13194/g.36344 Transcript_13194/m.36344 type:complete len:208 (-) Transcript_13194:47-670(-)